MATIAPRRPCTPMDEGSFEALVRASHPLMFGLARALTSSQADANLAVREAWQDVIGGLGDFVDGAPPRAWILGLVADRVAARRERPDRPPVASPWVGAAPTVRAGC